MIVMPSDTGRNEPVESVKINNGFGSANNPYKESVSQWILKSFYVINLHSLKLLKQ